MYVYDDIKFVEVNLCMFVFVWLVRRDFWLLIIAYYIIMFNIIYYIMY